MDHSKKIKESEIIYKHIVLTRELKSDVEYEGELETNYYRCLLNTPKKPRGSTGGIGNKRK